MINEKTAERVLEAALETGGDFSEIFSEDTETRTIAGINGKIETAASSHAHGAGVRVLCGELSAYAYTSDTSEEALIKTARAAAAVLNEKKILCDAAACSF